MTSSCARRSATLAALLALSCATADARSAAARREFQRLHPCPATGQARGACPGWQIDHVTPLCSGGADRPANMQWLTVEQHKAKTREDVRICRTEPAARNYP